MNHADILGVNLAPADAGFQKEAAEAMIEDAAARLGEKIGIDWKTAKFTPAALAAGIKVELEHGSRDSETNVTNNDPEKTAKIAWAHLKEDPKYYDKLAKMEKSAGLRQYYQLGALLCLRKYAAARWDVQAVKIKPIDLPESSLLCWLVDGTRIRDDISVDFVGGGHHYVYPWIPEDEIWIAADTPEADRAAFLVHELRERALMIRGEPYESAHEAANQLEKFVREHPEALKGVLTMVVAQNETPPVANVSSAKDAAGARRRR